MRNKKRECYMIWLPVSDWTWYDSGNTGGSIGTLTSIPAEDPSNPFMTRTLSETITFGLNQIVTIFEPTWRFDFQDFVLAMIAGTVPTVSASAFWLQWRSGSFHNRFASLLSKTICYSKAVPKARFWRFL